MSRAKLIGWTDTMIGEWVNCTDLYLFSPATGGGKQENLQCIFPLPNDWANLTCIGAIHTEFEKGDKKSSEWHYSISSARLTARKLLKRNLFDINNFAEFLETLKSKLNRPSASIPRLLPD